MTYKYEYAGFWLRFGAMIIDTLVLFFSNYSSRMDLLSWRLRSDICYRYE